MSVHAECINRMHVINISIKLLYLIKLYFELIFFGMCDTYFLQLPMRLTSGIIGHMMMFVLNVDLWV